MSLERTLCEAISQCRNCARNSLMMIEGLSVCNNVYFSEWVWRRKRGEATK